MKIKSSEKFMYAKNPLIQVLAQIRFDRCQSLMSGPTEAQKRVFANSGFVTETIEQSASIQIEFGSNAGESTPPIAPIPIVFHYGAVDEQSKLSVCADFIAVSCTKYVDWTQFKSLLLPAFTGFAELNTHLKVNRVGLRYRDLIERENLGLQGVPWSELLAPIICGVFGAEDFFQDDLIEEAGVEQQVTQVLLNFRESKLLLQSALLRSTGEQPTQAVLIDTDFYRELPEKTASSMVGNIIESLHKNADAAFRCCIKEKLHVAFGPT